MAVTVTKAIVILVLWACLIGVGYLTTTGALTKARNANASSRNSDPELVQGDNERERSGPQPQEDNNWFDYDRRENGNSNAGLLLPFASKRIAQPMAGNREQRWIASAAGIKSNPGASSGGNNDNDNNAVKVRASLLLNGHSPFPPRSRSHSIPTSADAGADPDPIETQVHEPIILSQDEKYQIINGVEEIASGGNGNGESESNISRNRFSYDNNHHSKQQQQQHRDEYEDDSDSEENDNEREQVLLSTDGAELLPHFPNSKLFAFPSNENDDDAVGACRQLEPFLAALVHQMRKQEQDREHFKQLLIKQESSISKQLKSMNERLEASVQKMDAAAMASQISLQLSKESFHQMDRIQETADDVLFQVRALKTELGHVGQASVQAIYNIQRSEENLMKQLGESWNRTIYALRQEPSIASAAAAETSTSRSMLHRAEQMQQPHEPAANTNQEQKQQEQTSSSSAPSPTFVQEKFIQADSASSINRNDDDGTGTKTIRPLPANDGRQESERHGARNLAKLSLNHTKGLRATDSSSSTAKGTHVSCSSRKKLINPQKPRDCSEIQLSGHAQSGLFNIYPFGDSSQFVQVYCDLDSSNGSGGGWTVIQRRGDYQVSRENFQRTWQDYEKGFGSPFSHFWIGLATLSSLTAAGEQVLRIELTDWDGVKRDANYGYFRVSNASDSYKLHVTDFVGNAGDSLTYHNGMSFSTMDVDNDMDRDVNCAQKFRGGWWYRNCHQANLNGLYLETGNGKSDSYGIGVNWYTWHGYYYSLKHVEMKIRRRALGEMMN